MSLFVKAFETAVTSAAGGFGGSIGKVGGLLLGQAVAGGGSRTTGAQALATGGAKAVQSIVDSQDLDKFSGIGAAGFVQGISDYRTSGAAQVQSQMASISDRNLQGLINELKFSPKQISPDVEQSIGRALTSSRSVSSQRGSSKYLSKLIKKAQV